MPSTSGSLLLLYVKLFTHKAFEFISPVWFMVYLYILLKNLIISNIQISKRILRPDMKLSPANSITLTPGTLTLDIKDDMLFIHVIEYDEDSNKGNITKEFEDIIAKI